MAAGWNHKNEGYHFYHLDEQNSTAYITGMEGGIKNRYQYDAFGVITDRQEGFDNRILYTGQQYDPITEQYYLRARYYNPAVGRFLQEDVYRGDGLNLYAYCWNNLVTYYDPSGYGRQLELYKLAMSDASVEDKLQALIQRRDEYIQNKINKGTLKVSQLPVQPYELEVETYHNAPREADDMITPHHMPSAESMKGKVAYDDCSCLNVLEDTHQATFTYGMEGRRQGDKALYESLPDDVQLQFDNDDVINAYSKTRPNVDIKDVEEAVQKQKEHSKGIIEQSNKPVEEIEDEKGACQKG